MSQQGFFSRREAENLIRKNRLTLNGKLAKLGDKASLEDVICVDGDCLEFTSRIKKIVLAFYKPRGVESTWEKNPETKTLADYDFKQRVFNVGRLDKDSHGLLLLTNDGELANQLMHPKYHKEKEYLVVLNKEFDPQFLKKMSNGIEISKGKKLKNAWLQR